MRRDGTGCTGGRAGFSQEHGYSSLRAGGAVAYGRANGSVGGEVIVRVSGSSILSQESRMQHHQPR